MKKKKERGRRFDIEFPDGLTMTCKNNYGLTLFSRFSQKHGIRVKKIILTPEPRLHGLQWTAKVCRHS